MTSIGEQVFKGCSSLANITLPSGLTSIGEQAFKGCNSLTNIYLPANLTTIGEQAFNNCNNLNITVSSSNLNYSAEENILYNKDKTALIAACKISPNITILNSVTEISPYAFANNSNLSVLRFENNLIIGESAFANCSNMNSVYFESYSVPTIGSNSFSNNNFVLYTPYISQNQYQNIFTSYTNNIVSIEINVFFVSNGETIDTINVYNGSVISNLLIPVRTGYTFDGWYSSPSYTGTPYQNGNLWESEINLQVYAKWIPNQYVITLDANGGSIQGLNSINVTYGSSFATASITCREGYTFDGWYDSQNVKYMTVSGESTRSWDKAENSTLYAHWSIKSYEIQINDNGSITWLGATGLSDTSCSIEYGTNLSAINLVPAFKQSNHGFKEGKIFDHFEYGESTIDWTSILDLGENGDIITIIPVWILEEHTICFKTLSSIVVNDITANYDENISFLENVIRTGYVFNGWYTSNTYEEEANWLKMPDLTPTTQNNGFTTLFAKWTANTYTIYYNSNGGVGTMNPSIHTYDISKNLSTNSFTRTYSNFTGWAKTLNGDIEYYNGQSVLNLTSTQYGSITLYAVWKGYEYSINYYNLTFMGQTADVILDNNLGYSAPTTYEYGIGLNLNRVSAFYQSSSPYSPQLRFLGWYTDMNFNTQVTTISTTKTGPVTLYAKWRYDFTNGSRYGTYTISDADPFNQSYDSIYIGLASNNLYQELTNIGIKKIYITFKIRMWEVVDGTQYIYFYGGSNGTRKLDTNILHVNSSHDDYPLTYSVNISELSDTNYIKVRYKASSSGWWLWKSIHYWKTDKIYYEVSYVVKESDINSPEFYWHYQDPFI